MNSGWLPVGAAAATSAVLLFAAQPDSPGGMLLAVLATLPLFLVGLSWGLFHGAASGAAASIAILGAVSVSAGLYYGLVNRSEERRGGTEGVSTGRSRVSP